MRSDPEPRIQPMHLLLTVTLLVPLWIALRPHGVMALLPADLETWIGRSILVLFLAAVLMAATRMLPAHLLRDLRRAGPRAAFTVAAGSAFVLYLAPAGLVPGHAAQVGTLTTYGPLAPWPALQAPLGGRWALRLGLGHLLVAIVVALLAAVTTLAAWSGRTRACRRGTGAGLPALFLGTTCPGCLPSLLLPLAAVGLGGSLAAVADPTAPASALLIVAAPLVALLGVHLTRDRPSRAVRPVARLPRTSFVALPLAAMGLPRGGSGRQDLIHDVYVAALVGAVVLTAVVFVVLAFYLVRYRATRGDARARRDGQELGPTGRRVLVALFLLVPAAAIYGIGIYSDGIVDEMQDVPEDAFFVDVTAAQFAWEFHYADGNMTRHQMFVPMGETIVLNVTTKDVVHSLFIPEMGVKIDAMPDRVNQVAFTPERTGSFDGYCAEHCGVGHTEMLFTFTVLEEGYEPPFEEEGDP